MPEAKQVPTESKLPDMLKLAQNMALVFQRGAALCNMIAARPDLQKKHLETQILPFNQVAKTLGALADYYKANPEKLMAAQMQLWQSFTLLWQRAWARSLGQQVMPLIMPLSGDKRFMDVDWQENTIFDFMKQAYLIAAEWTQQMVANSGLDAHEKLKAKFYVEQLLNAFSPSNFPASNPEVLKTTLATNGENLLRGMDKLERDFDNPEGRLHITQTDTLAYELGRDLALTPGKVIFRNDIFELIQYIPVTPQAFEIPLLIVPPWINKFYILDLTPQKSFVKFCVENGITVFIVSWVNASEAQALKGFADYMRGGFLTAIAKVQEATGASRVNTLGFCIGGTLAAIGLGYLAARNDASVNAATFLTTQVDFEHAGDLRVFVDDEQVKWIEERMQDKGYLPGSRMADAFNLLRSNDLIWSCVVNNYFLGKAPMPYDLLYWNSDTTRMPAGVHSFYLRQCYLNNCLSRGTMVLENTAIDLGRINIPVYNLAARDDHIAPLKSVFRLKDYFGGPVRLVVSGSGHIAGVVNPPELKKYQFWVNDAEPSALEDWMAGATETPGSWWPDWLEWISAKSGVLVKAPVPGEGGLSVLEDAPGSFVRVK